MRLDTEQEGLNSLYDPHTAKLLQYMWDNAKVMGAGASITELQDWHNLNAESWDLRKRSRPSIVKSLEELERDKVIEFYEIPGKGGHRRMYYQAMSPLEFSIYATAKFGDKMAEVFKGPWWKP